MRRGPSSSRCLVARHAGGTTPQPLNLRKNPPPTTATSADHRSRHSLIAHSHHLPQRNRGARDPVLDLDRQRPGVHHPLRPRRHDQPQRVRDRARPTTRPTEELQTEPPHHLRQSGALPTDDETLATRPTSRRLARRAATTAGPLRRRLQPPPPTPLTATPLDTRGGIRRTPQS